MLPKIGCPPKLLSIIRSFHDGMMSTVQFDGDMSAEFEVKSGVEQGCVLNRSRFHAKTKIRKVLIRDMLFADAAALASHDEQGL